MTVKARARTVHRLVYELEHGSIPAGLFVLHTCDVKNCINVKHLWVGTHRDNMQDMLRKGRGAHQRRSYMTESCVVRGEHKCGPGCNG